VSKLADLRRGVSISQDFRGRGGPMGDIFVFYKTRHFADSVNCTMLCCRPTQHRHVTDGRTDGRTVTSTALAMRALGRAVNNTKLQRNY